MTPFRNDSRLLMSGSDLERRRRFSHLFSESLHLEMVSEIFGETLRYHKYCKMERIIF
jgi:hypothetical protein